MKLSFISLALAIFDLVTCRHTHNTRSQTNSRLHLVRANLCTATICGKCLNPLVYRRGNVKMTNYCTVLLTIRKCCNRKRLRTQFWFDRKSTTKINIFDIVKRISFRISSKSVIIINELENKKIFQNIEVSLFVAVVAIHFTQIPAHILAVFLFHCLNMSIKICFQSLMDSKSAPSGLSPNWYLQFGF